MLTRYRAFRKRWIGFDDLWLMVLGIPLVGYIMSFLFYDDFIKLQHQEFSRLDCFFVGSLYTAIYWISFTEWAIRIREKFPEYKQNALRLIITIAGVAVLYFVMENVVRGIRSVIQDLPLSEMPIKAMTSNVGGLIITFLCLSIYENIYYHMQLHHVILEKEKLTQANLKSELAGLRNQINPHFFFNSLNTLMDIVSEDTTLATKYIQNLSKIFRYVLEASKNQLVPVKEELEFIKSFSFILLERFKGNLLIHIEVPPDCETCYVPPMSLQMLIENAIKHNIISTAHPLKIEIYVDEKDYLIVRNNLQLKSQNHESTGIGLDNIKKRYQYLTDKKVIHDAGNNYFVVMLPIIETNNQKVIEMYEGAYYRG